jgi:hypothetical protein
VALYLGLAVLTGPSQAESGKAEKAGERSLPLHLQFPASDAPPDVMLRWILSPGNKYILQDSLREGYLKRLPAERFPEALRSHCLLQGRRHGRELACFIEAWAERDPKAAWQVVETWIPRAVDGEHFVDEWSEKIRPPLTHTRIEPGIIILDTHDLYAFEASLSRANVPPEMKRTLQEAYDKAYARAFPREPDEDEPVAPVPAPPEETTPEAKPPPPEVDFSVVQGILDAPIDSFPALLEVAVKRRNEGSVICGLRRWVLLKPGGAPEVISWAKKHAPDHVEKVVEAWAAVLPKEALAWTLQEAPDDPFKYASELIPHLNQTQRRELLQRLRPEKDPDAEYDEGLSDVLAAWAVTEPEKAFAEAMRLGRRALYSNCAKEAFYQVSDLAEPRQRVIDAMTHFPVTVSDDYAYIIMEEWGDIDFAEAARYGVDWLIKEIDNEADSPYTTKYLVQIWTGKDSPADGCMDDRTYGCLRMWAVTDPEGMNAWIETVPNPELRKALEWLRDHAEGFEPEPQ